MTAAREWVYETESIPADDRWIIIEYKRSGFCVYPAERVLEESKKHILRWAELNTGKAIEEITKRVNDPGTNYLKDLIGTPQACDPCRKELEELKKLVYFMKDESNRHHNLMVEIRRCLSGHGF